MRVLSCLILLLFTFSSDAVLATSNDPEVLLSDITNVAGNMKTYVRENTGKSRLIFTDAYGSSLEMTFSSNGSVAEFTLDGKKISFFAAEHGKSVTYSVNGVPQVISIEGVPKSTIVSNTDSLRAKGGIYEAIANFSVIEGQLSGATIGKSLNTGADLFTSPSFLARSTTCEQLGLGACPDKGEDKAKCINCDVGDLLFMYFYATAAGVSCGLGAVPGCIGGLVGFAQAANTFRQDCPAGCVGPGSRR
ncbi:MAG: hypothetical protein AAGB12_04830 [Pseudomonadota bacterium]